MPTILAKARVLRTTLATRIASSLSSRTCHSSTSACLQPSDSHGQVRWLACPVALGLLLGGWQVHQAHQEPHLKTGTKVQEELPAHPKSRREWHLLNTAQRRRTFYKYERRLRDLSQKDKVFHYFASKTLPDGTKVMTPGDLVRAVIAVYPPEESEDTRSGSLAGEPSRPGAGKKRSISAVDTKESTFLKAFDIDRDGISFSEYLLLLTFLKLPAQDVNIAFQMFDLDGDGIVQLREFEEITGALQKRLRKVNKVQRTGATISQTDTSQGLKSYFFGPQGNKSLELREFSEFIDGMHEELLRLEFEHYDTCASERISGLDFARSILSSVDLASIDVFLDRVAALPTALATAKVDFDQFRNFAKLHQHIHSFAVALEFYHNVIGKLEREDFKRATKIVAGREISDEMVDIVYHLFDKDGDNNLSSHELIAVLRKREGSREDRSSGDERRESLWLCFYACAFERD